MLEQNLELVFFQEADVGVVDEAREVLVYVLQNDGVQILHLEEDSDFEVIVAFHHVEVEILETAQFCRSFGTADHCV